MDMETQNSKDRAKYAHLKRDILGDGIKESKLAAYETLAKNLNNNSGDGSESLPVYGIYWADETVLVVYEVNDFNNIYEELDNIRMEGTSITVQEINDIVSKPIFIGVYDGNDIFIDENKNITITTPELAIINLADDVSTTSIKDNQLTYNDILNELNIDKGFIFGYFTDEMTDETKRVFFTFIANKFIEEGASGFGIVHIHEV